MSFDEICLLHGTDKASTQHDFCNFYEAHLDMKQIRSVLEQYQDIHNKHARNEPFARK